MQMKNTVVADILSDLIDVSERLAQMIQFFIITLFLCRLLSDVCYEEYMTVDILLWWICSTVCDYVSQFE